MIREQKWCELKLFSFTSRIYTDNVLLIIQVEIDFLWFEKEDKLLLNDEFLARKGRSDKCEEKVD